MLCPVVVVQFLRNSLAESVQGGRACRSWALGRPTGTFRHTTAAGVVLTPSGVPVRRPPTIAAAALAVLGLAAPASADHNTTAYTTAEGTSCYSGQLASGTGQALYTDKAKIKTTKAGVTTWTCTFTGVGASSEEENGYFDYVPPTTVVRYTSPGTCMDYDDAGFPSRSGDAEVTSKPNGTITIRCTLAPPT